MVDREKEMPPREGIPEGQEGEKGRGERTPFEKRGEEGPSPSEAEQEGEKGAESEAGERHFPEEGGERKTEKEKRLERVEQYLQEGLEEVYAELEDAKKQDFKEKGETVAQEINSYLDRSKPKPEKIVKLIKKWLYALNFKKEFTEQEAKKKADRIINLKSEQ